MCIDWVDARRDKRQLVRLEKNNMLNMLSRSVRTLGKHKKSLWVGDYLAELSSVMDLPEGNNNTQLRQICVREAPLQVCDKQVNTHTLDIL